MSGVLGVRADLKPEVILDMIRIVILSGELAARFFSFLVFLSFFFFLLSFSFAQPLYGKFSHLKSQ